MFHRVLAVLASFLGFHVQAQCPDFYFHETAADCPWAGVTRATTGVTDPTQLRAIFDEKVPGFMAEIDRDGNNKDLLNLWSLSSNIDQSNLTTGIKTIPENLLQYFVSLWNVPYNSDFTIGHAGLNHTYGYLLSNLYTPYGFKRARYVSGEIEAGFGLPESTFGGLPKEGTLLSNLTYFAGTIGFRDSTASMTELKSAIASGQIVTVPALADYAYCGLSVKRLVEVVQNSQFYLELRTDIVQFPNAQTHGSDTALLIYTVDFHAPGQEAKPRLVTAFPVQASFATGLFDPTNMMGDQLPIKLKYNLALPVTVPAELMVGKRFIFNESVSNRSLKR